MEREREKTDSERRTDLKTLADAYLTSMHHERAQGHLIPDDVFHADLGTVPTARHIALDLMPLLGTTPSDGGRTSRRSEEKKRKSDEAKVRVPCSLSCGVPLILRSEREAQGQPQTAQPQRAALCADPQPPVHIRHCVQRALK